MVDTVAPPSAERRSLSPLDWRRAAWLLLGLALLGCWVPQAHAADAVSPQERGATIVHLLDYVAVDYPEFVKDGKVLDEAEYKEQLDFVGQAITSLEGLPDNPARAQLLDQARALLAQVQAKAAGDAVNASANRLEGRRDCGLSPYGRAARSTQAGRRRPLVQRQLRELPRRRRARRWPGGQGARSRRRPTSTMPIACACAASTGCTTP